MLKKGDKIDLIKFGRVVATDEVVKVQNGKAITRFGKRFNLKSERLFPIVGHRNGFEYRKRDLTMINTDLLVKDVI